MLAQIGSIPDYLIEEMSDSILKMWRMENSTSADTAVAFLNMMRSRGSLMPFVDMAAHKYSVDCFQSGRFESMLRNAGANGIDSAESGRVVLASSLR